MKMNHGYHICIRMHISLYILPLDNQVKVHI